MTRILRIAVVAVLFLAAVHLAGCTDNTDKLVFVNPTSPSNVVSNLRTAYTRMDAERYADLLADDFRFYFDPATRLSVDGLPEYWDRSQDSTGTAGWLFSRDKIEEIRISLLCGQATPVNELGRERWMRTEGSAFMEVDRKPEPMHEPVTYYVDNQKQTFYFRRGRNPADTLASSPTSQMYFLVEWRDQGGKLLKPGGPEKESTPVERTTWSTLKTKGLVSSDYRPRTSEGNVLYNLGKSYVRKDAAAYAQILADDFRFYFDPATRVMKGLPEYWTRAEDSTGTALSLLSSERIGDIGISIGSGPVLPYAGGWSQLPAVASLNVEVKPTPDNPEGMTLIVDHQGQTFYFRKGRSPGDTLAASPTSQQFYLVEWHDLGAESKSDHLVPLTTPITWSQIKAAYR